METQYHSHPTLRTAHLVVSGERSRDRAVGGLRQPTQAGSEEAHLTVAAGDAPIPPLRRLFVRQTKNTTVGRKTNTVPREKRRQIGEGPLSSFYWGQGGTPSSFPTETGQFFFRRAQAGLEGPARRALYFFILSVPGQMGSGEQSGNPHFSHSRCEEGLVGRSGGRGSP